MNPAHTSSGCTIWFTGLSGSGKTMLSRLVREKLLQRGCQTEILDGDVIRQSFSRKLGFSKADRDTQVRNVGWRCKKLTRQGIYVCAALISPYEEVREEMRHEIQRFMLVYCKAPLEVLEARDVKGLYRRARAGEIKNFTGIDDPYEEPQSPDLVVHSDQESVMQATSRIIALLEARGYLEK